MVSTIPYLAMFAGYLEMKSFLILSLLAMSSSSPPQPQNMLEKPLTSCDKNCKVIKSYSRTHLELVDSQRTDPTKDVIIGKPIEETVDGDGHVSGLDRAGV